MNQTTKIAAVIILLFFVFITLKGQLKSYIAVFFGAAGPPANTQSTNAATLGTNISQAFIHPPAGSLGADIQGIFSGQTNVFGNPTSSGSANFLNINAPNLSSFFGGGG